MISKGKNSPFSLKFFRDIKPNSSKMSLFNVPNAVEYVAIREYSDVKVRLENSVKRSKFFISEKCIWHPDPTCIRHCQITNFI